MLWYRAISNSAFALTAAWLLIGCGAAVPTIANYDWDQTAAAIDSGAQLVDARSPKGYESGTIPGSLNVPCSAEPAVYSEKLPEDRAKELIFYCGGPQCSASTKGANAAL